MHWPRNDRIASITRVFGGTGHAVEQCEPAQWDVQLGNGQPFSVRGRLSGEWLTLETPLPGGRLDSELEGAVERGASLNAQLPGATKLALCPKRQEVVLRNDIPAFDRSLLDDRILLGCRDLERASARLAADAFGRDEAQGAHDEDRHEGLASERQAGAGGVEDVLQMASQSGWVTHANDSRSVVDLAVEHAFYQAAPEELAGRVRLRTDVGTESQSGSSRLAVRWLLLTVSALFRSVRAGVRSLAEREAICFEVVLPPRPSAVEVDHALTALSVAGDTVARELNALADDDVAQAYLHHVRSGG